MVELSTPFIDRALLIFVDVKVGQRKVIKNDEVHIVRENLNIKIPA